MFVALVLIALFLFALLAFKARGGKGRFSRLILTAFAFAWSPERLDRQKSRRYATR